MRSPTKSSFRTYKDDRFDSCCVGFKFICLLSEEAYGCKWFNGEWLRDKVKLFFLQITAWPSVMLCNAFDPKVPGLRNREAAIKYLRGLAPSLDKAA